ncbi:TOBE domain protein [Hydrogenobacter thermophilus TK-6]|uniref:Molybdenum-pterin binding protein n=1 Tax=Hydrogenobacter thermophilus (strain DSM 6534 / IAM 12695 / TK-6) TaxID=608538 RepID=D3DIX2_HYDTT|nr:TOBE domain-containing protein [Hydrogenobacter thermophilus]ADO45700.1 TOBE domain protein [Hydrogenobacter thermophilus TK-6]BAI69774.1 molybdenum-pterin binding protein [Hydrogenobacter thermophilus TK-6]
MEVSARNKLKGTVKKVLLGQVAAEVVMDVGGQEVVAVITRQSAQELNLKEGDSVYAVIKATDVMIGK